MRNLLDQAPSRDLHGIHAHAARLAADELAGSDVLGVGCGFGWFELLALDRGAASVVGLEPSGTDLATARKHAFAEFRRVPDGLLDPSTPYSSLRARALDPAFFLTGHRHTGRTIWNGSPATPTSASSSSRYAAAPGYLRRSSISTSPSGSSAGRRSSSRRLTSASTGSCNARPATRTVSSKHGDIPSAGPAHEPRC